MPRMFRLKIRAIHVLSLALAASPALGQDATESGDQEERRGVLVHRDGAFDGYTLSVINSGAA